MRAAGAKRNNVVYRSGVPTAHPATGEHRQALCQLFVCERYVKCAAFPRPARGAVLNRFVFVGGLVDTVALSFFVSVGGTVGATAGGKLLWVRSKVVAGIGSVTVSVLGTVGDALRCDAVPVRRIIGPVIRGELLLVCRTISAFMTVHPIPVGGAVLAVIVPVRHAA